MRSGAMLLAAAITVPFGAPVPVHLNSTPMVQAGAVIGDFLVAAPPRAVAGGGSVVMLRPLSLGTLSVPLAGAPDPGVIQVQPTRTAQAPVAAVVVPPPPPLPWGPAVAVVAAAALALGLAAAVRRRRRSDPVRVFARTLAPLETTAGWDVPTAPDVLARACRKFLEAIVAAPCPAMTTRELTRLLAARLDESAARPFALALVLADEVRYADQGLAADDAAGIVRELLAAAPTLVPASGAAL